MSTHSHHGRFDGSQLLDDSVNGTGRAQFRLLAPFGYKIDRESFLLEVVAPRGYVTDYASIPRFFWRVFPPWGKYRHAAVIHDVLYSDRSCPRAMADAIFLDAMNALGVPWYQRWPIYAAVRCFGWIPWRRTR